MPPIVHGWSFGSPQFGKPVADEQLRGARGLEDALRRGNVRACPTWNTDASTWSFSTSSVASGGVLFGS